MARETGLKNHKKLTGGMTLELASTPLMLALLLVVFALACAGSNGYILRSDEVFSVANMGGFNPHYSPAEIVASVAENSPDHVPLYFVLGAGWAWLAGWTQFALRISSVLTALLMLALMYRFAADYFDRFTGLLAAYLLSCSAFVFLHIHDFRMYPFLLLLSMAHCWLYFRLESGRARGRRSWLAFIGTAIALIYTHTFSIMLFAGLSLYHLLIARRSAAWRRIGLCWIMAALAFLPYLPTLVTAVSLASANLEVTEDAGSALGLIAAFGHLLANGAGWLLIFAVLPLAYALLKRRDPQAAKWLLISLTMLAVPLALNEIVGLIPLHRMRYFLILWFPFTLLLARGLSWLPRRKWLATLCIALWALAGIGHYSSQNLREYIGGMKKTRRYPPLNEYVRHLRGQTRAEDYLLGFTVDHFVNSEVKFERSVADFYTQIQLGIDGAFVRKAATGAWLTGELDQWNRGNPQLLFAYQPDDLPRALDGALYHLSTTYKQCEVLVDLDSLFAQRYALPLLPCDRPVAPVDYGNGIRLADRYAALSEDGGELWILAGWETPHPSDFERYNVSFQILRGEHDKVDQRDFHLYHFLPKWNSVEFPIDSLAPGRYRLVIILYPRGGGPKIQGVDVATGFSAAIHDVAAFDVE